MFNYPDGLFAAGAHFVFSQDCPQGTVREVLVNSRYSKMSFKITFCQEQEGKVPERSTKWKSKDFRDFFGIHDINQLYPIQRLPLI